jgi:hypothetical protein
MKLFFGLLMLFMLGVAAQAQDTKVYAELTASSERIVKNSPFSADAVSESVQTLADGNRIVRSSTNKLYRNSEGRFRRELGNGSGSTLGMFYSYGPGITILDPVAGFRYQLDTTLKTARQALLKSHADLNNIKEQLKTKADVVLTEEQKAKMAERYKGELKVATTGGTTIEGMATIGSTYGQLIGTGTGVGGGVIGFTSGGQHKYESKTENLGVQNIEGVEAEGTRTTTTIPAGAIGNERPIDIVYERWYSNELKLVVMSKHNDPRFGEQTYRLTNIVRSEPDPSLFSLPTGYKMLTEPTPRTAPRVFSTPRVEVERAAAVRAASGATDKTKP